MSRKLVASIAILTVLILIALMSASCVSEEGAPVPISDYEALQTQVSTLESRLATNAEAIADLETIVARLEAKSA